jgi:hypothetical protein
LDYRGRPRFFAGLEQFFDALSQCDIAVAGSVKIDSALRGGQPPDRAKDGNSAIRGINHGQFASSTFQCE